MVSEIRGAKGGGDEQRPPIEAPDSLRSAATARIVDLLGEGPIEGLTDGHRSIYLEDTPLQNADMTYNFKGVQVYERLGHPEQPHIPGFPAVEAEVDVSTQVKVSQPVVRRVVNLNVDAVRIKIRVPALQTTNQTTGDIKGTSVKLAVDIMLDGGAWVLAKYITISGKTSSSYERQTRVDLPGEGPWDIRVRRITADSTKSSLQNSTFWATYTEITDVKLSYPDSALVGIQIDARQFGNSVPGRSYDVKGRIIRVPTNYDPTTRAYTGIWEGTFKLAWTDNPAWVFYDLATNTRFGAALENVDKWSLYQIGRYCDELVPDGYGGVEPRFTINTVISAQSDAVSALSQLASVFRGMTYWGTNAAVAVADMPTDPVKLVTPANVIDGAFEYSGTSLRDRHTAVAVSWNDPADRYRQQPEIVEDPEGVAQYGWKQLDITAVGCTSRGQARRLGLWALYSERYETETVTYRAGIDHMDIRPGDVVAISDPAAAGARYGGRVLAATVSEVTLDQPPASLSADQTWHLDVVLPSGAVERRAVASVVGQVVHLAVPLTATPLTAAMWVLSSQDVKPSLFRIVSAVEEEGPTYRITGAAYDPRKYDVVENGLVAFDPKVTRPGSIPSEVTGLSATDYPYKSGSGISTKLSLSWDRSDDTAVTWRVCVREADGGNWTVYSGIVTCSIDIPNVTDGASYVVECYGVSSVGVESPTPAVLTYTVLGKTRPPATVTGFRSVPDGGSLRLLWENVADIDLKEYEVRYDDTGWGDGELSAIAYRGPNNGFTAEPGSMAFADSTLFVRAVDTSGNYSENSATLNLAVARPGTPLVTVTYHDTSLVAATARLSWEEPSADFAVYQYRVSVTLPGGSSYSTLHAGTTYEMPLDFLGSATVAVAAVDAFGQASDSIGVSVTSLPPVAPSAFDFDPVDVGVLGLSWSANGRTTLPIAGYEVRTSDSGWGSGGHVHRGPVAACQLTDVGIGISTYFIRSYDTEGRYSQSSLEAAFEYAGPIIPAAPYFSFNAAASSGLLPIRWPELESLFGVDRYEVTLARPAPAAEEKLVTRTTEWRAQLDWVGTAVITVVGYDNTGAASPPVSVEATRLAPGTPGPATLKLISFTRKAMTVEIGWATEGVRTTLPLAGYELRTSDSGWGSPGAVYRGEVDRTTLANLLPDEDLVYYLKAYDAAGAYSTAAYAVNILKNVGPEPVTNLTAKPNGQNLRIKWKAAVSTGGEVRYEVRNVDANWGEIDDTRLYYGSNTYFDIRLEDPGTYTFFVKALDKFWEYSYAVSVSYDYETVPIGTPTHTFGTGAEPTVVIKWPQSKPAFGLSDYVFQNGADTLYIKSNSITVPATWLGPREFNISVRDRNQNVSDPVAITVDIAPPVTTGVAASITIGAAAKNKGTLYLGWTAAAKGSLPIRGYELRSSDENWGLGEALYEGANLKTSFAAIPMNSETTWYLRAFDNARNYSAVSKVIVNDGVQPPAAVSGLSQSFSGSALTLSWARSPEPDVIEYEVRTSNSGWGTTGHVYRGPLTTFNVAKPPTAGATYYLTALDAYGQRSPAVSTVFSYPVPAAPADTTYAFGSAAGTILVDWPDTNPPLGLKHYKVTYRNGASSKTVTSKASSTTITPTWSGQETVEVRVVDTHGAESAATLVTISVAKPGVVATPTVSVTSIKAGSQTVLLDWLEPAAGSFKIVGYEVRTADAGWGGSGYAYKGAASQASLAGVSTVSSTTWYIRAYDSRGNYSETSATLAYSTTLPFQVTSVKVSRVGAAFELNCVTPAKPDNFSHIEYRVGKVVSGAATGDDTGTKEGVVSTPAADIWGDPDVLVAKSSGTSDKASLSLQEFPKPLISATGITYRVAARVVDKSGNLSPVSAMTSIVVKSLV